MIGVIVNTAAVIVGSLIGLLFRRGIPEKISTAVMTGIGLCTIAIGVTGLSGGNTIIMVISVALGAIIGTIIGIDKAINKLGDSLTAAFRRGRKEGDKSFGEGFVTACLVFCVGSMTIVGSLQSGLTGDHTLIYTKSTLDFISSMMLSVSLGAGVIFAAGFVLVFQGALVLLAGLLSPILGSYEITQITCVGSLLITALGLNITSITKIKVADFLPALIIAPLLCMIPLSIFEL